MLVPYTAAMRFIERHNENPIVTLDGILVVSPCRVAKPLIQEAFLENTTVGIYRKAEEVSYLEPDVWIDEQVTFPINDNGMVDSKPIRQWLGY